MVAAAASASLSMALSSVFLSMRPPYALFLPHPVVKPHIIPNSLPLHPLLRSSVSAALAPRPAKSRDELDGDFFDGFDPDEDGPFDPDDDDPFDSDEDADEFPTEETEEGEEEIVAPWEKVDGRPAFSGRSVIGENDDKGPIVGFLRNRRKRPKDGMHEHVLQVRRVTKVTKGGRRFSFRAIVVVGDKKGIVGVGIGKAKDPGDAILKSSLDARKNTINVPITKYSTFPHRSDGDYGAAKVMLRPAAPGTGLRAGAAVRAVCEMAGVTHALGKQLGSHNPLNNARATLVAMGKMRHFRDVALDRGIPIEELWK